MGICTRKLLPHVGKIEKLKRYGKRWQKMAKMASEAETKILHEMGGSTAKILAKAKATAH